MSPAVWHRFSIASLLLLFSNALAWEATLSALAGRGTWLTLKALPLLLPLRGVLAGRRYTLQWLTLLVWLYFIEGVMRAFSESGLARTFGLVQVVLALACFTSATGYVRATRLGATEPTSTAEAGHSPR
jgi:uncharacterized membrane protein